MAEQEQKIEGNLDYRSIHPFRKKVQDNTTAQQAVFHFAKGDFVWTNSSDVNLATGSYLYEDGKSKNVPHIVITEFQPDFLFNYGDAIDKVASGVGEIFSGIIGNKLQGNYVSKVATQVAGREGGEKLINGTVNVAKGGALAGAHAFGQDRMKNLMNDIQVSASRATDNLITVPMDFIKRMFSGNYLSRFYIPCFEDTFLQANGDNGWSQKGAGASLGNSVVSMVQNMLPLNFPGTPEWNNDSPERSPELRSELILVNRDTAALVKNMKFLHALTSGAFWTQIGLMQKSPNLYNVEFPGRFNYYYCTLEITVAYEGHLRIIPEDTFKKNIEPFVQGAKAISSNMYFPDAYKIQYAFKSLAPNNFNVYLNYLTNGTDQFIKTGSVQQRNELGKIKDVMKEIATTAIGKELSDRLADTVQYAAEKTSNKAINTYDTAVDYVKPSLKQGANFVSEKSSSVIQRARQFKTDFQKRMDNIDQ